MTQAKPYEISKEIVWIAYKKVKANRGAAGVDGQSLADFEKNLENHLYKLWNRMSSGSYFPTHHHLLRFTQTQNMLKALAQRSVPTTLKTC